ncbi:hypothetical protein F0L74_12710 [Chitinophaga agrisoli]|uniref:BNR repeat neuraminidase n=1 Tax=Chitinophaga agrisoli TaxID=2607653 RepID=A0A5B2VYS6_9BACT|nr:hypothetical protein [Chitinophaga agrisoli]KAA2243357.1 hypothetical protein F0L74_12710 [Chitinophaga agrisoli]
MHRIIKISLLCVSLFSSSVYAQTAPSDRPVFSVDAANPTADKPQSKLWFQDNCWWALLPRSNGPSLWQRTTGGWKEHPEVNGSLKAVPGRADVWADKDGVTAVGVAQDSLVVFRLTSSGPDKPWKATVLAVLKTPAKEDIETATIARDDAGEWWVAADGATTVYAWHAGAKGAWSQAISMKRGIGKDDISVITALPGAVMVSWSNQKEDAVQYRLHRNGHAANDWEGQGIVEAGNKTADDHLHTALTADGTVWMVSKNSIDSNSCPQLVLRVRNPAGVWSNFPYAPRTAEAEPSRPVIIAVAQRGLLLTGHTIYDKTGRNKDRIEFAEIDTTRAGILVRKQVVIVADASLQARVNNCTVSRAPFPADAPWIVLASDETGRVYEADLRQYFH